MAIICYRKNIKVNQYEETISFAFNCIYDNNYHLKLKDCNSNNFDSGDFRTKLDDAISKLNSSIINNYIQKNNGVQYLGLLNYFCDEVHGLYSIKFESENGDSIYYADELNCINNSCIK